MSVFQNLIFSNFFEVFRSPVLWLSEMPTDAPRKDQRRNVPLYATSTKEQKSGLVQSSPSLLKIEPNRFYCSIALVGFFLLGGWFGPRFSWWARFSRGGRGRRAAALAGLLVRPPLPTLLGGPPPPLRLAGATTGSVGFRRLRPLLLTPSPSGGGGNGVTASTASAYADALPAAAPIVAELANRPSHKSP